MGAVGVSPVYAGREVAPTCITLHFPSFLISESCRIHGKKIFDFWILASAIPPKQPQRIGKSECHPISATLSRFAGIVRSYFRGADWPLDQGPTFPLFVWFLISRIVASFYCDATRWAMDKAGVAVALATISVVGVAILFAAERVHTGPMDFIERYFGFSPDNGDGSTEILVGVALVSIIVVVALRLATKK